MPKFFITTAIDYPNSRPHIGTAFEKIGADVQARYRRMQGYRVHFLMGNDENTVKVSRRAAELGQEPKAYCDEMANQFKEVWRALDISFDDFIQTSEPRHHKGCQQFIQRVFDGGWIRKGTPQIRASAAWPNRRISPVMNIPTAHPKSTRLPRNGATAGPTEKN